MRLFDRLIPASTIPRHGHAAPYAAVVLAGGYEEAGDGGRFRVAAGDVLVHGGFSAHLDRDAAAGTMVLNLPLSPGYAAVSFRARADDPDRLARLAERDPEEAGRLLVEGLVPADMAPLDGVDALAAALSGPEAPAIAAWAGAERVSRETAWRWFRGVYGVSPARYRVEARARRAWRRLTTGTERLVDIASGEGFSDQAHLGRDIRALTGRTPGQWRAMQHSFKTARA